MKKSIILLNLRDPDLDRTFMDSMLKASIDMIPLGLYYIATILEKEGYLVEVIDFNILHNQKEREAKIEEIIEKSPKIIGISVMTPTYPQACEISKKIRKKLGKGCKIVYGGYHVTFFPEDSLVNGLADIIVRGEGEFAMLKLANIYFENSHFQIQRLREIPGISYIAKDKIIHNPPALVRIDNLDSLPFPRRDFINPALYRNPATIVGSRGCIARCQFCAAGAWGPLRARSPENIVEEIEWLTNNYGFRHIYFVDNTFTSDKNRTMKLLNMVKERRIEVTFSAETRVTNVDEELINALAKGGVIAIQFGVESGDPFILKDIKKGITIEQVDKAVELCLSYGIKVVCSFVIGHPSDTLETIRRTINYGKKLRRKGAQVLFSLLSPFPGTEVFNKREELGVTIVDWDYRNWSTGRAVISTRNLSRKELARLYREAISEVYAI